MARKGKMVDHEIESKYLNETKIVKIYYPETFSDLYKYNICIMFDGDDYYQMGRIATYSDKLHADYELTNTIFVGIHYKDAHDRRRKYHPDGEEHGAFTNFVVNEVVPMLDRTLPTYHMGKSRILMGDSLAGTFSLLTALKYPNTFGKIILQSPYIDEPIMEKIQQTKDASTLDIYHTIGAKENEAKLSDGKVVDQLTPNRELNKFLSSRNSTYLYHELEDGLHTWKYWQKDMVRALTSIID